MAYINFSVVAIETDLKEQSIYITFNREVDIDSINLATVTVALRDLNVSTLAHTNLIVSDDLKMVTIKFLDSPQVNTDYVVILQNTITDITGNELEKSLFRNVSFKSTVTSDIELVSPANFEVLTEKKFIWQEVGDTPVNNFRVQISTDTAFSNVLIDSLVSNQSEITFGKELKVGQYFFRVRAELGDNFGTWSDTRTFLVQSNGEFDDEDLFVGEETDEVVTEAGEPTFENLVEEERTDLLKLLDAPDSGVTPDKFSFLFDDDIDISNIKVSITRGDF